MVLIMKKLITFVLIMIVLVGCEQQKELKTFELENVHKIVVLSVDGQQIEITDTDNVQKLTENISAIQFEKAESSKDSNGFGPIVQWYDANDNMIEVISIMGDESIIYNNFFWTAKDGSIDRTLLDELMNISD